MLSQSTNLIKGVLAGRIHQGALDSGGFAFQSEAEVSLLDVWSSPRPPSHSPGLAAFLHALLLDLAEVDPRDVSLKIDRRAPQ